ncbi:hypothetical protein LPB72_17755 [Hydrogenophaga crassostreae]|uniref:Uncharacterized protein n=1 Tax=Hydrogenophaga crassostreae TaxID=1763535 RepID=A0A167GYF9_9BURK|nr:hypothetical protein LPB072_08260 [Hydrogenophaga crassostreae]OAD40026.1 hypothetical protein LPB72_17755 [Hydrogenophaga crassostreae]
MARGAKVPFAFLTPSSLDWVRLSIASKSSRLASRLGQKGGEIRASMISLCRQILGEMEDISFTAWPMLATAFRAHTMPASKAFDRTTHTPTHR